MKTLLLIVILCLDGNLIREEFQFDDLAYCEAAAAKLIEGTTWAYCAVE